MGNAVTLLNAALDDETGAIVLRGVISPESLKILGIDDYQREVAHKDHIRKIMNGIRKTGVPDIQIGMRGGNFDEHPDGSYTLHDPTYIIDGQQRREAALELMHTGFLPRLGGTVYFNTDKDFERNMFKELNMSRLRLSSNILLHNERPDNPAVELLYNLSCQNGFVLANRVSWKQNMKREHLIPAVLYLKTAAMLMRHLGGYGDSNHVIAIAAGMYKIMDRIGATATKKNVIVFWDEMDDMYRVQSITYREKAAHMRAAFLLTLTSIFDRYTDFWRGYYFHIPSDIKLRLATFNVNDPHVLALLASSRAAKGMLTNLILEHVQSGRRGHKLTPFASDQNNLTTASTPEELSDGDENGGDGEI